MMGSKHVGVMRSVAVGWASVAVACGRIGFDAHGGADGAVPSADAPADAAMYRATAVRFERAGNDYMTTDSLDDTSDAPRGTYSAWFHFTGGDDQLALLSVAQVIGIGGVLRETDDRFRFLMQNCLGVPLLDMHGASTVTTASGWVHVMAAWDVSAGLAQLYVDDVADLAPDPTINNGSICYGSLRWGIGGLSLGRLDADVAEIYAALGTFIDLDVESNRRMFADAAGKPVELGASCMAPTGAVPTGCFTGPLSTWHMNKGVGAGFMVAGDGLVLAPTSPSD